MSILRAQIAHQKDKLDYNDTNDVSLHRCRAALLCCFSLCTLSRAPLHQAQATDKALLPLTTDCEPLTRRGCPRGQSCGWLRALERAQNQKHAEKKPEHAMR